MKILFITHHYLSSNGGGSFASRAYINAFAEIADEMTLLYPVKEDENLFPEINKKIRPVPVEYKIPKWRKFIDLFCGRVHRYYNIAPKLIESGCFDVVVFDTSMVSYRLVKMAKKQGAKTIVIHHNYQYEYFRDNARGVLALPTLFWCKRYEKQAVVLADLNFTLTNQDIVLLSDNYCNGNRKNFSLLGAFEYTHLEEKNFQMMDKFGNHFVITGNLEASQTALPLHNWLVTYYPLLRDVFPKASLTIAGKNPSDILKKMCKERNISLIPSPVSMDPIMEAADYYICPTDIGGGIKLRIMDGLKFGLPVITHAVSARGYDLFKEQGCLFSYEKTSEFREALIKLKQTSFSKKQIYSIYRNIFSFEAGVDRVKKAVYRLVCSKD